MYTGCETNAACSLAPRCIFSESLSHVSREYLAFAQSVFYDYRFLCENVALDPIYSVLAGPNVATSALLLMKECKTKNVRQELEHSCRDSIVLRVPSFCLTNLKSF